MYVWVFECKCVCLNVELHICFIYVLNQCACAMKDVDLSAE